MVFTSTSRYDEDDNRLRPNERKELPSNDTMPLTFRHYLLRDVEAPVNWNVRTLLLARRVLKYTLVVGLRFSDGGNVSGTTPVTKRGGTLRCRPVW